MNIYSILSIFAMLVFTNGYATTPSTAASLFDFKRYDFSHIVENDDLVLSQVFNFDTTDSMILISREVLNHAFSALKTNNQHKSSTRIDDKKMSHKVKKVLQSIATSSAKKSLGGLINDEKTIMINYGRGPAINWKKHLRELRITAKELTTTVVDFEKLKIELKEFLLMDLKQAQTELTIDTLGKLRDITLNNDLQITHLYFTHSTFSRNAQSKHFVQVVETGCNSNSLVILIL